MVIAGSGFGLTSAPSNVDPWQIAQPANMAQIQDLQVQCEKDMMRVRIIFDRPFYGMVFSKGHYSNVNCVHVPAGLGQTQATFDISLQVCGPFISITCIHQLLCKDPFKLCCESAANLLQLTFANNCYLSNFLQRSAPLFFSGNCG